MQRVALHAGPRRLARALSIALALALLPGVAWSQAPPMPATSDDQATSAPDLPLLLFYVQRPDTPSAKQPARKDDPNTLLKELLRTTLNDSGRFQVITYSPTQPRIKRALLEHAVDTGDLIEPIKPEALQRLARVIGARYLLMVGATLEKTDMKTEVRFLETMGPMDWRTILADHFTTEQVMGKKHLKTEELVDFAVDGIALRLNIPSHLASRLATTRQIAGPKPSRNDNSKPASSGSDTGKSNGTATIPGPQTAPTSPAGIADSPGSPVDTTGGAQPPGTRADRTTPSTTLQTDTGHKPDKRGPKPGKVGPMPPNNNLGNPNLAVGGPTERTDAPPNLAPPAAKQDNEAIAVRFRQTGDLANAITSLRHAINERPRDMDLRRRLIQWYQERQMPERARTEIANALQFSPNDSSVYKLYGDTLMAQADTDGALKAYREAVRLDPNSVVCQVALGDALFADNQYTDAFAAYQAAAKADAKSPLPHRRMARALAARAEADPAQYTASIAEIKLARSLIPATDTQSYLDDYAALMTLMERRLRDMLDEVEGNYRAKIQGKRTLDELNRTVADLKLRAESAGDYLENVPAAAGQDATHESYQLGAALLMQTISHFRDYLTLNEPAASDAETKMKGSLLDARRELTAANKRLSAARAAADPNKPADLNSEKTPIRTESGS